ncbi:MAG: transposase [Candidatus Hydrogenedentota bacterium]|nr:MAG: transposase [Candidatus Hydrogenedentota bacterium]
MARPLRIEFAGAFYHITARGNERKDIFKSIRDRSQFLSYLESATERYKAVLHVYCLMTNHYHLLLETPSGNLSQIMRHINGAYTTYFNTKRKRSGHLFQGRYKGILVEADEYAKELSRYIHLNPVRAGMVRSPGEYRWSSYRSYIGKEKPAGWLARGLVLGYFGKKVSESQRGYCDFVEAALKQDYRDPLSEVVGSAILGSVGFVERIRDTYLKSRKSGRDLPSLRALATGVSSEEIEQTVDRVFGADPALARKVKLHLYHTYTAQALKEIGMHFGIKESGVSLASSRMTLRMEHDAGLRAKVTKIKEKISLQNV